MATDEYRDAFAGFEWPWYMPSVDDYELLVRDSPFKEANVWGENADRYFPNAEAMLDWIDHPAIVPFNQHLHGQLAELFHAALAVRMVEETKQNDGTCFEMFRRVNVSHHERGNRVFACQQRVPSGDSVGRLRPV